jgi:hypothetical protein
VIATRRSDLGGWIVSLVSTEALARATGWRMLDDIPFVLRCRVKRVWLTRSEVFEVVRAWGVRDAEGGRPISFGRGEAARDVPGRVSRIVHRSPSRVESALVNWPDRPTDRPRTEGQTCRHETGNARADQIRVQPWVQPSRRPMKVRAV